MLKRLAIIGLLCACVALLTAADPPPEFTLPVDADHTMKIVGNALTIQPSADGVAYLRFTDGVVVTGEGFTLTAGVVELDVKSGEYFDLKSIKLPEPPEDQERIVNDPGQTIADMAKELKVPRPDFSASSVLRVGAAGGVTIKTRDMTLTTAMLVSTDGGATWAAEQRSVLRSLDPETGEGGEISADYLLYDIANNRMLARGNIISQTVLSDGRPLRAEAQQYELDLDSGTFLASDKLRIFSGDYMLCCGRISVDLQRERVVVSDFPHLLDKSTGRTLDAETIETDLSGTMASARGNVRFSDPVSGLGLTAGEVNADLAAGIVIAGGEPEVRYRDSTYRGHSITVTLQDDGKVVVEVAGPQEAVINIDELETAPGLAVTPPPATPE